ncbi:hypothetical protein FGW20_11910 [Methanoculleus sp. FWC-SCC3]|uniref:Uncharacterized protein n=1 Tax=Methanoculleus methanifontis TaxID=2584086 RepID=A0ABT8M555_9EURY|nr:hypothetical protein [Methanoculleus sp. FWC-SCC3]MDN7013724.1 hypothetical protein [Methanoculleus sp. FWC-SCC3]
MPHTNTSAFPCLYESISRSRLRFAIPPLVAVIAWAVWVCVASVASGHPGPMPLYALLTLFLVLMILAVAGAATPFPLVAGVLSFHGRIQTMLVTAAAMTPLVFPLFITPHRWRGEPPLLADRLPIFGWLLDDAMSALPLAEDSLAHGLVFSAFTFLGFYLECVLVAAVFYILLRAVISFRRPNSEDGSNTK